ncbi:hypothetical protein [Methanobacterium sp.]|uniref:hypothetical protein n=1 Tax=Methanobacterium sp. TaxID=2164 RepID=UPI003C775872
MKRSILCKNVHSKTVKIKNHPSEFIKMDITVMDAKRRVIIGNSTKITMDGMMRRLESILKPNETLIIILY